MTVVAAVDRLLDVSSRRGLRRAIVTGSEIPKAALAAAVLCVPHRATVPNPPRAVSRCPCCGAVR